MKEWEEVLKETDIVEAGKIILDALCHGFEFKVENYKLYARETPTENSTK